MNGWCLMIRKMIRKIIKKLMIKLTISSWKTRLGFYLVISSEIFKSCGFTMVLDITTIGFAFLFLGIAHKTEGK